MVNRNAARHLMFAVSILLCFFIYMGYRLRSAKLAPESGPAAPSSEFASYPAGTAGTDDAGAGAPASTPMASLRPQEVPAELPDFITRDDDLDEWVPVADGDDLALTPPPRNSSPLAPPSSSGPAGSSAFDSSFDSTYDDGDFPPSGGLITGLIPSPPEDRQPARSAPDFSSEQDSFPPAAMSSMPSAPSMSSGSSMIPPPIGASSDPAPSTRADDYPAQSAPVFLPPPGGSGGLKPPSSGGDGNANVNGDGFGNGSFMPPAPEAYGGSMPGGLMPAPPGGGAAASADDYEAGGDEYFPAAVDSDFGDDDSYQPPAAASDFAPARSDPGFVPIPPPGSSAPPPASTRPPSLPVPDTSFANDDGGYPPPMRPSAAAAGAAGAPAGRPVSPPPPPPVTNAPPPPTAEPRRPAQRPQPASESLRIYVVRPGDTLSSIASNELGSMALADNIFLLNRDVIADPDHLMVGIKIRLPIREGGGYGQGDNGYGYGAGPGPGVGGPGVSGVAGGIGRRPNYGDGVARTHIVVRGDTLSSIAQRYYGSSSAWNFLYQANRTVVPNPNTLSVGVELTIPPYDNY